MLGANKSFDIPRKRINLTRITVQNSEAKVMFGRMVSRIFKIVSSVRQGVPFQSTIAQGNALVMQNNLNTNGNHLQVAQAHANIDYIIIVGRSVTTLVEMTRTPNEPAQK